MTKTITERDRELIEIIDELVNWIHDYVDLEQHDEADVFHRIIDNALVTIYGENIMNGRIYRFGGYQNVSK